MSQASAVEEVAVSRVDLIRTRVLLAKMQGRQERLAASMRDSGIEDVADRLAWLMDERTADEQLAWRRRWEALGVTDPAPHGRQFDHAPRPVPVRRPRRVAKVAPAIAPDRQMEIALAVLAAQEAREGEGRHAA